MVFVYALRFLAVLCGTILLVFFVVQNDPMGALQTLGVDAPGVLAIFIRATRLIALMLIGPALILIGIRPSMWRAALIPFLWAIVSTIIVYPREFDFLF